MKILESCRSQILTWHNQAYVAATASLGVFVGITKLWLDTKGKSWTGLAVYEGGVIAFTVVAFFYLRAAQAAYNGLWELLVKCEYALRLKDHGFYFEGERFAGAPKEDKGMPSHDIPVLKYAIVVIGVALAALFALNYTLS